MKLLFVILAFIVALVDSAKILGVFPFGGKSHYAIGEATLKALVEAGHEVTMISVFEPKQPIQNYKQIKIRNSMDDLQKGACDYLK